MGCRVSGAVSFRCSIVAPARPNQQTQEGVSGRDCNCGRSHALGRYVLADRAIFLPPCTNPLAGHRAVDPHRRYLALCLFRAADQAPAASTACSELRIGESRMTGQHEQTDMNPKYALYFAVALVIALIAIHFGLWLMFYEFEQQQARRDTERSLVKVESPR